MKGAYMYIFIHYFVKLKNLNHWIFFQDFFVSLGGISNCIAEIKLCYSYLDVIF